MVTSTIQLIAVLPKNGMIAEHAAMNRIALKGLPSSFVLPNHFGTTSSLASEYSTRDAAKELKITELSVRQAINNGKLKASKFGKAYMITKKDLDEYLFRKRKGD